MNNHEKISCFVLLVLLLFGGGWEACGMQKILVVVDSSLLGVHTNSLQVDVNQYLNDIAEYDHKKAGLISWQANPGTIYHQCDSLWHRLHDEYVQAIAAGDVVEGAVLIGNVPIPLTYLSSYGQLLPFDQAYMDIVDQRSGQPPRYTDYSDCPFPEDVPNGNCFCSPPNNCYQGDQLYDIWVSRINAQYLDIGIRQGIMFIDEIGIYSNYFTRMHNRMSSPAAVPLRGFAMGGPSDYFTSYPLHSVIGNTMRNLNLPWLAEFTAGENSSYNWVSQLLAGPRGCINYGGFYGTINPSERNRRYCRYGILSTVYLPNNPNSTMQNVNTSDSLGWEWAGVYNHSNPEFTQYAGELGGRTLNGYFTFGTLGPFWGSSYIRSGGPGGSYYYYQDNSANTNPYNRTLGFKEKYAKWRWAVQASGTYNIYAYYVASPSNCNFVCYYLENALMNNGVPITIDPTQTGIEIDQRNPTNPLNSDPNWHCIFPNVSMDPTHMAIIYTPAWLGYHPDAPGDHFITGDQIVSGVRFISTGAGVDQTVNAVQPATYQDVDDWPQGVFSTNGCFTSDEVDRSYEEMGDEPGGGGYSKTQFFMTNACQINDYIYCTPASIYPYSFGWDLNGSLVVSKNLGNLYALGHNGLACMGTATADYSDVNQSPFTTTLANGGDLGEAFLAQQNAYFWYRWYDGTTWKYDPFFYSLLGAGSLRTIPYVQFGSWTETPRTISDNENTYSHAPVEIQSVNVTATGNWTVTSVHDGNSPFGTHSEIVVWPECDFAPTGSDSVHLVVSP